MNRLLTTAVLGFGTLVASHAMAATVNQGTGYAISQNGSQIFAFSDLSSPVPSSGPITLRVGVTPQQVDAIAYRPATGGYFAYSDGNDTVYSLDVATGSLTQAVTGAETSTDRVGFDFNNMADAARIVSRDNDNLVYSPANGTLTRATDLAYAAGDDNDGVDPRIVANAYTNAVPAPSSTQQYALDARQNKLVTLANNAGTLATLGSLIDGSGAVIDFDSLAGFDILSPSEGDNLGLAMLQFGDISRLYSFALPDPTNVTGNAGTIQTTLVAEYQQVFRSFAVAPNGNTPAPSPIPLPASALLLLGGMGGLGALKRLVRKG